MREISGDHSGGETPVPIPNTAVKPTSADGTALATGWESRSLPGISLLYLAPKGAFLYSERQQTPARHLTLQHTESPARGREGIGQCPVAGSGRAGIAPRVTGPVSIIRLHETQGALSN